MPHLRIEYSPGLEEKTSVPSLMTKLHAYMVQSPVFPVAGIRVRAFRADFAIVADGADGTEFLNMQLAVGTGRSTETLRAEGDALFAIAQSALADLLAVPYFALSFEIRELNPDLSWKDTPIHKRLSKPT